MVFAMSSTALVAQAATGFEQCPQFFFHKQAPLVPKRPLQRALCYEAFAILHSGESKTPVFVAQRLNRSQMDAPDLAWTDKFFADARLPRAERAELSDYKRSGYSRGHMAPAGDMDSVEAMAQSFSLANVVPQAMQHNSGPWAKIEKDTRRYVRRAQGDVFVITGPMFAAGDARIGANQVRVPHYLYKLVYDATRNVAWAHWHENQDGKAVPRPISYGELVQRTGIDFFPALSLQD